MVWCLAWYQRVSPNGWFERCESGRGGHQSRLNLDGFSQVILPGRSPRFPLTPIVKEQKSLTKYIYLMVLDQGPCTTVGAWLGMLRWRGWPDSVRHDRACVLPVGEMKTLTGLWMWKRGTLKKTTVGLAGLNSAFSPTKPLSFGKIPLSLSPQQSYVACYCHGAKLQ